MENYKTITVLDYSTGKVTQYNLSDLQDLFSDGEAFIGEQGHDVNDCHWMIHELSLIHI